MTDMDDIRAAMDNITAAHATIADPKNADAVTAERRRILFVQRYLVALRTVIDVQIEWLRLEEGAAAAESVGAFFTEGRHTPRTGPLFPEIVERGDVAVVSAGGTEKVERV